MPSHQEHAGHHHEQMETAQPEYPRMGKSQEHAKQLLSLEQLQKMAGEANPTLRQAEADIRAAKGRQQQSGLYPNPTVGYTGDEIRGGSVGGGKQGFFVQQTIVTGGKLGLNRAVYGKEAKLAELEAEQQKLRVTNAVKIAFVRVLAAQELLDTGTDLAKIAQEAAETEQNLMNTGQADETEVLEAEVAAQRMRVAARMQENMLREQWRSLTALVGQPDMPLTTVAGELSANWPEVNEAEVLETISKQSPSMRIAQTEEDREVARLARARRQPIPDLQLLGGLEYNNDLLANGRFTKGWEGLAEFGVQLPIFNRNQGEIAAAKAEVGRAELEKTRVALSLRDRAASIFDQYANALLMVTEYRDEILPRAKKAYALMFEKHGQMLASYPRVLELQTKLYELHGEYLMALAQVWTNGIALQGFLLTDGLEAPGRPSEMDRPSGTTLSYPEKLSLSPETSMPRP